MRRQQPYGILPKGDGGLAIVYRSQSHLFLQLKRAALIKVMPISAPYNIERAMRGPLVPNTDWIFTLYSPHFDSDL